MKFSHLSVAIACSLGLAAAQAEDNPEAAAINSDAAQENAEVRWNEIEQESSLLAQAQAATASLRALAAAELGIQVETVNVSVASADQPESRNGYCQHLPRPGSRIMQERCFYPDPGEQALNDYQFQQEIDQIRYQQGQLFLEHAEYSEAFRRSLGQ